MLQSLLISSESKQSTHFCIHNHWILEHAALEESIGRILDGQPFVFRYDRTIHEFGLLKTKKKRITADVKIWLVPFSSTSSRFLFMAKCDREFSVTAQFVETWDEFEEILSVSLVGKCYKDAVNRLQPSVYYSPISELFQSREKKTYINL